MPALEAKIYKDLFWFNLKSLDLIMSKTGTELLSWLSFFLTEQRGRENSFNWLWTYCDQDHHMCWDYQKKI